MSQILKQLSNPQREWAAFCGSLRPATAEKMLAMRLSVFGQMGRSAVAPPSVAVSAAPTLPRELLPAPATRTADRERNVCLLCRAMLAGRAGGGGAVAAAVEMSTLGGTLTPSPMPCVGQVMNFCAANHLVKQQEQASVRGCLTASKYSVRLSRAHALLHNARQGAAAVSKLAASIAEAKESIYNAQGDYLDDINPGRTRRTSTWTSWTRMRREIPPALMRRSRSYRLPTRSSVPRNASIKSTSLGAAKLQSLGGE